MTINVLVELDDVRRSDLGDKKFRDVGDEALVEVVPDVLLFQVRVHARKRRRHELLLRATCSFVSIVAGFDASRIGKEPWTSHPRGGVLQLEPTGTAYLRDSGQRRLSVTMRVERRRR
jgi:hypothetical protein